jgi:hypothetical protein
MNNEQLDLLHRSLSGVLTPEELESLENLLRTSANARATLRSLATIDAKWQQLGNANVVEAGSCRVIAPRATNRSVPLWFSVTMIAASMIFGVFGWFRVPEQRVGQIQQGIARIIRIEGDCTTGEYRNVVDGTELFAGEKIDMQRGLIELAFRETGVHVVATAPLKMMLESDQQVLLHEGQVKLVVPPQGVGFVVHTPQRKFVDLGTSFVVTAGAKGSEVLVLDGQISVDDHEGTSAELMHEGEFARFDSDGKLKKRMPTRLSQALPELSLAVTQPSEESLRGVILGYNTVTKDRLADDVIGRELLPLIQSGFKSRSSLESLQQGKPLCFRGIAGAFHEFPNRTGLTPYSREGGWMTWYHGKVMPPKAGRYRFWGYADNHLLVAINGESVFEGSRRDSSFKELGIERTDNPALPCLIARAGFASSDWVELEGDAVQLDILFGEVGGNITSGLLLVEREGDAYEETIWGQPKWPLFLTQAPSNKETAEFRNLADYLEQKTMGSFSVSDEAIWKVAE